MDAKLIYKTIKANGGWIGSRLETRLTEAAGKYPDLFHVAYSRSNHPGYIDLVAIYYLGKWKN